MGVPYQDRESIHWKVKAYLAMICEVTYRIFPVSLEKYRKQGECLICSGVGLICLFFFLFLGRHTLSFIRTKHTQYALHLHAILVRHFNVALNLYDGKYQNVLIIKLKIMWSIVVNV